MFLTRGHVYQKVIKCLCKYFAYYVSYRLFAIFSGSVFVVFGPNYAYVLLRLLYTRDWSDGDAAVALGYYCVYILALALNGM